MPGYTITLYVATGGIGHGFVKLEAPSGESVMLGYYPVTASPVAPGVVIDDSTSGKNKTTGEAEQHSYSWSKTFEVSQDQFYAGLKKAADVANNSSDQYSLLENQCTAFARDVLDAAGIPRDTSSNTPPSNAPSPDSLIFQYQKTPTNQDNGSTPSSTSPQIAQEFERARQGAADGGAAREAQNPSGDELPPVPYDPGAWQEYFEQSEGIGPWFGSPLALDLDGDGIETMSVNSGAHFDHNADGFAEATGWISSDDGLLAMDRDGDGIITSGRELFGSETVLSSGEKAANGFAALSEFDGNSDGSISDLDAAWANVKIWRDLNGNNRSDDGELIGLTEAGIATLNLSFLDSVTIDSAGNASWETDAQGNQHRQLGQFVFTNGSAGAMHDVWFDRNPIQAIPTSYMSVSSEVAALPNSTGSGTMQSS